MEQTKLLPLLEKDFKSVSWKIDRSGPFIARTYSPFVIELLKRMAIEYRRINNISKGSIKIMSEA